MTLNNLFIEFIQDLIGLVTGFLADIFALLAGLFG